MIPVLALAGWPGAGCARSTLDGRPLQKTIWVSHRRALVPPDTACTALRPRLPEHRTTIVLFAASALALPAPLLTTGAGPAATAAMIALVVCFGLDYGLPDLLCETLVVDYYGSRHYPRINGTLAAVVVAARASGPLLAGLAIATLHTQSPTLAGAAALTAISSYALQG